MRVLSWNVNRSGNLITEQADWLTSLDKPPDILLLQEVNLNRLTDWTDVLTDQLGYTSVVDTIDWGRELNNSNGHITATLESCELKQHTIDGEVNASGEVAAEYFGTKYPEKILVTDIVYENYQIECWNVRAVPGNSYPEEKKAIFQYIFDEIEADGKQPRLLAGT